jgi:hypothetical protein
MRSITLMGAAAAVLTVSTLLAVPASAERICRQVCDEGFCRSRCVESRGVIASTCMIATETTTTTTIEALNSVHWDLTLMWAGKV